jgi:hypothetical protein
LTAHRAASTMPEIEQPSREMPSPSIKALTSVQCRVRRAQTALDEAVERLRAAAALPDCCAPVTLLEDLEQIAAGLAALRTQISAWALEEHLRDVVPASPLREAVRELIGEGARHQTIGERRDDMRCIFRWAMILAAFVSLPRLAFAGDYTTQDLLQDCQGYNGPSGISFCLGYLMGTSGQMVYMHSLRLDTVPVHEGVGTTVSACREEATAGAMKQAFINWAEKSPQAWKYSANDGVMLALHVTWPCR